MFALNHYDMILMQWYADFTHSEENVMKDDAIYQVNNKQDNQYLPIDCQVLLQVMLDSSTMAPRST